MREDGGSLTIRSGPDDTFVLVEVEDTGPGIRTAQRARL